MSMSGQGRQLLAQSANLTPSIIPLLAPYLPVRDIQLPLPRTAPSRPRRPRHSYVFAPNVEVRSGSSLLRQSLFRPPTTFSHVRTTIRSALSSTNGKDPYLAASNFLDGQFVWTSSDLAEQRHERIRLYTLLVQQFLHRPSLDRLIIAIKLLKRQHTEGLPVDPRILTVYLKASLAQPAYGRHPMRTIAAILPLLPQQYDKHLLTLILHTVVKYEAPEPEEVKRMIDGCLGVQTGKAGVGMEEWDLELWDVYLGAILAKGKYREGINLLVQFQSAVRTAQKRSIEAGIPVPDKAAIARPYISLLTYWVKSGYKDPNDRSRRHRSAVRNRNGSEVPLWIARHGLETLGGAEIPLELLNAWMSAELAAGNVDRAGELWTVISGGSLDLKTEARAEEVPENHVSREEILQRMTARAAQVGDLTPITIAPDLGPDTNTYTTVSRLMKRLSMSASRPFLQQYLSRDGCITTESLNSVLSMLFTVPTMSDRGTDMADVDLPAVLVLLERFDSDTLPNNRTIDVVAAGMLKLSRHDSSTLDQDSNLPQQSYGNDVRGLSEAVEARQKSRLNLQDRNTISRALHALRDDAEPEDRIIGLPLGRPLGQLVDNSSPNAISTTDIQNTVDIKRNGDSIRYATRAGGSSAAEKLLPALKRFVRQAIGTQLVHKGEKREVGEVLEQARRDMGFGIRHG